MTVTVIGLPAPCTAAAAGHGGVWCAAGARLLSFDASGTRRHDVGLADKVASLGAAEDFVVAVWAGTRGVVTWLDAQTGEERHRVSLGGELRLVSGGGSVWALDPSASRAWRLDASGGVSRPRSVPSVEHAVADGERLWWMSRVDTMLRDFDRAIEIDVEHDHRGALAVCAGSVWVSAPRALVRVGAWGAEKGRPVEAPVGPVPFLTCAGGVLVGVSKSGDAFVLDPAGDSDARRLDVDLGSDVGILIGVANTAWAFMRDQPQVKRFSVRPGPS